MKKLFLISLIVLILSGCDAKIYNQSEGEAKTTIEMIRKDKTFENVDVWVDIHQHTEDVSRIEVYEGEILVFEKRIFSTFEILIIIFLSLIVGIAIGMLIFELTNRSDPNL